MVNERSRPGAFYVALTYSPQTNKYDRMTVLNLTGNNCGRSDIMNQLHAENELMGLLGLVCMMGSAPPRYKCSGFSADPKKHLVVLVVNI